MADPHITLDLAITVAPETFELLERQIAELKRIAAVLAPIDGAATAPDVADGRPRTFAQMAAAHRAAAEAILPDGESDDEPIAQCRAEVHRQGRPRPYWCTRSEGHDGAHLARVDGVLLACEMCTGTSRRTVGMVCQTCGTDYAQEV